MIEVPVPRLRPMARVLVALWFGFAGLVILGLAGEVWLRVEREQAWKASERLRTGNVFFTNLAALNAGERSLWHKPWRKYEPGARAELLVEGQRFFVQINRLGYRTREFSPQKPEGTVRVLCIGGSTTVAGRTNDETYPAFLEARLRRRWPGLPLEVLNLGISGVNSEDWLAWLDKLLSWEPDLIVHYEAINDISWLELPRYASRHPFRRRLRESLLLERLLGFDPAVLDPDIRSTLRCREEMDRRCRSRDVAYLTATFAAPDVSKAGKEMRQHLDTNIAFWTRYYPVRSFPVYASLLARHNSFLSELTVHQGMSVVRVHERITDPALFIDACHLTPEGIEQLADAFFPAVAEIVEDRPAFKRWAASR